MNREVECMCLECGISLYLDAGSILLGEYVTDVLRAVEKISCMQCGGQLAMVGLAGEEPHYRIQNREGAE